ENLPRGRRDRPRQLQFDHLPRRLHGFFLFSLKCPSNSSSRSLQNRSYSCTQPETSRSGSGRNEIITSPPCPSREIRPARSSNLRCFVTALSDRSNGLAISVNRAGPPASRPMIARRDGCDIAVSTSES